jgi:hypothetical protein
MATNLRLSAEAADALREAAAASGRPQQELLREAVDRYLGLTTTSERDRAVASGMVKPPTPFLDVEPSIRLRGSNTSLDLLERDGRA